jgi:hypothetical protein
MRFEDLLSEFSDTDGVTLPHGGGGFGRSGLRYSGKIFAMFVRGDLVVKLPARRVDELVTAGHGRRFDANKGTPMREWFAAYPDCPLTWSALAREALDFARQTARTTALHPADTPPAHRPSHPPARPARMPSLRTSPAPSRLRPARCATAPARAGRR